MVSRSAARARPPLRCVCREGCGKFERLRDLGEFACERWYQLAIRNNQPEYMRCLRLNERQSGDVHEHRFTIEFQDAGVQAYAFTFG